MPCSDCSPTFTVLTRLKECELLSRTRSNQSPLASERIKLDELVSQAEKELVQYEETIARLQETIVALTNERRNLIGQVRFAKSLLAPIRKLPSEVMSLIFIHHGYMNIIGYIGGSLVPGMTVASICSYWRSIALSTTALWNDIEISGDSRYHQPHVSLIEILLERSGGSLLSVQIDGVDSDMPASPGLLLLWKHANRWRSIDGICRSETVWDTLPSLKGRLDCLHAFQLLGPPFSRCSPLLENASKLRSLTLYGKGLSVEEVADNTSIPWKQIVNLEAEFCSTETIMQLLSKAANLLTLTVKTCQSGHFAQGQHVRSLLNVLNIELDGSIPDPQELMIQLSDMLILPKLHSLSITSPYGTDQKLRCSSRLSSLVSRSSATVTSFILEQIWIDTNDLLTLLGNMPTLTLLSISVPYLTTEATTMLDDRFLSRLNCHLNRQPLLPRLLSLILEGCWRASFDMRTFVEVIQSRWKPSSFVHDEIACIKTVKLTFLDDLVDIHVVQPLMVLKKRGLDILIQDREGDVGFTEEVWY